MFNILIYIWYICMFYIYIYYYIYMYVYIFRYIICMHVYIHIYKGIYIKIGMIFKWVTAWKVSKYGVISGPYFPYSDQKKFRIWTLSTQSVLGCKEIRHIVDVCPSPQSGTSRKKIVCNENSYEIDHAETSLWITSISFYHELL